jgi:hypothetical protein
LPPSPPRRGGTAAAFLHSAGLAASRCKAQQKAERQLGDGSPCAALSRAEAHDKVMATGVRIPATSIKECLRVLHDALIAGVAHFRATVRVARAQGLLSRCTPGRAWWHRWCRRVRWEFTCNRNSCVQHPSLASRQPPCDIVCVNTPRVLSVGLQKPGQPYDIVLTSEYLHQRERCAAI